MIDMEYRNGALCLNKLNINDNERYTIDDPEDRSEILLDSSNKIISCRKGDGTLVENVGIETINISSNNLNVDNLNISSNGLYKLSNDLKLYEEKNIPKFGNANITTETFYVTSYDGVNNINDLVCIQDFDDTDLTARDRMTICHYYVKSTLTENNDGSYSINQNSIRLQHYASGKVSLNAEDNKYYAKDPIRKINGICYYADSLGFVNDSERIKVIDGYTRLAPDDPDLLENHVKQSYVEVTKITGPACVNSWTVEDWDYNDKLGADIGKKYEHNCLVNIDFGNYLSKTNIPIGIKHQGNSTQMYRKRNFRFTFYKKNDYNKKDKVKIGEMLRLSGYNLKANWLDPSRIKEHFLYQIFIDIWQNRRPITDRYNWDNKINGYYHGATGNIEGFPVKLEVDGSFYGIYIFGLKKDEKNYLLNGEDEDGFLLSGNINIRAQQICWGSNIDYYSPNDAKECFDDEMLDAVSDSTADSLSEWHEFINNRLYEGDDNLLYHKSLLTDIDGKMYVTSSLVDGNVTEDSIEAKLIKFNKENCADRLDVLGFIDYMICLQVFVMQDSNHNNMMMYSDKNKKKIFPFFYDLDGAINLSRNPRFDIDFFSDECYKTMMDISLWNSIKDLYWDDIINRYSQLRKTSLSDNFILKTFSNIINNISDDYYNMEQNKWGNANPYYFKYTILPYIQKRLNYLDNYYFIK